MFLIVGLGNPGKKYQGTRHNVGFAAVESFAEKNNFPAFKLSLKFNALLSEGLLGEEKTILALPQTFMNESGSSVSSLIYFYKIYPANVVVIHDDMDIPLGEIKVVYDRGSAGHKGVESIIKEFNSNQFLRIRVGIQPGKGKPNSPEKFVLKKFGKDEKEIIDAAIEKAADALDLLTREGVERAMNEYNG